MAFPANLDSTTIRIGFYICHCGINIAGKVRVKEVASFAMGLRNVVAARDYKFMCSDPGQAMIERDIRELKLNRVVVASCSPRLHAKTFMGACQRAGLNPYYFQMASVREQVSWVTEDGDKATNKAKTLAAAAINRVNFHEKLEDREASVNPDVLVVGGGIAGMQASLDIAESSHDVYLVERGTTIGGHMLQFDKTFPTLDCAACIGTPKMVQVSQEPKIHLYSNSEVTQVAGFVGNYTVTIKRKPRYVKEGVCTGCGECVKVCPVSIPSDWDEGLAQRKAIGRAFPQAIPITFNIEKKDRAPCTTTCPAGVNVQGYIQLIGQGKYMEALNLIRERIPLPGVLGRVCPHPCESRCRRSEVDSPLAIRDLKRFAQDMVDYNELNPPEIEDREEKIAVIGSGPAGLTAAYYLRLKGYQITIFESCEKLGGMLRNGIPDYRLPPGVLDNEIEVILRTGIQVKTGVALGRDFSLNDLKNRGFSTIFLGMGAQRAISLGVPGEKCREGVIDALSFLQKANSDEDDLSGRQVAVIGGGNVAIDSARVALRLGAAKVSLVYRRSAKEMPAYEDEIQGALHEGIEFLYLTSPIGIIPLRGKAESLQCISNKLGPPDAGGRRRPVPIEGTEFELPCDLVIIAIGQAVDSTWAENESGFEWSKRDLLKVNHSTMRTGLPFVFAAGDGVSGPAAVIDAVAGARRAADAMDRFLRGEDMSQYEDEPESQSEPGQDWRGIPESMPWEDRGTTRFLEPGERKKSFQEVDLGFTEEEAKKEAARCLNCGICSECMECVKVCEAKAIDHEMKPEEIQVKVGSIILATGYDILNPSPMKQFGYGRYPNVFTGLEFERLSNATGPTGGGIRIRDANNELTKIPESVALLHCIGSRDVNYHEYCSRVCCMYALKYTHLIKEKVGHDTKVYDFYIDMRCFGKGYEEFYRRCQEEGTIFVRGKVAEITDQGIGPGEQGKLVAIAEDTLLGERIRVPVDMVILCTAMEAREDAREVGRVFGVSQGADGFFLEEHPKLAPLNTATDGVFLAGACQSPKDIPDTVSHASGAAAKAIALASRGKVEISPTISWIDPDICIGCKVCIGLCTYSAIEFDERRGCSVVNPALCKGCGSCSGFCPSGAATSKHFKGRQIFAEIDGIMNALGDIG